MFEVHLLNDAGIAAAARLRTTFLETLGLIERECGPEGREMALVRTHLEIASFYAKRAMAMRPENQKGPTR